MGLSVEVAATEEAAGGDRANVSRVRINLHDNEGVDASKLQSSPIHRLASEK